METKALEHELSQCSLHVLLIILSIALARHGFGDVEILDRRGAKQKSRYGGHEIQCTMMIGGQRVRVLVKIVERHEARDRMIHEMAGWLIDRDAHLGLVISPKQRSARSGKPQVDYPKLRVRVIEGSDFARFIKCSGIGVRPDGSPDYAYFTRLGELEPQLARSIRCLSR